MALHTKGTTYEKMQKFEKAIAEFKTGKQLVESTLGSDHQLYAVFSSAMGGAKLKTKYQTSTESKPKQKKKKSKSPENG